MPAIDYRVDEIEKRITRLEDEFDTLNDRVRAVQDNTTRILAIAEGVQRAFVFIAGLAVFVGALIAIYQAWAGPFVK